jgi:hypothetical protein
MDLIKELNFNYWVELGFAASIFFGAFVYKIISGLKLKNKTLFTDNWDIHSNIHECLTELRVLTDAARTQVIQFHNGEYFMDGVSMRKLSCTHESVSKGVSAQGDKTTNLLISLFAPLVEKITKDSPEPHLVKEDLEGFSKHSMEASNVHCYSVLPLKHKNNISGFIMTQWCSPVKAKQVMNHSDDIKRYIHAARNQIEIYLDEQGREK